MLDVFMELVPESTVGKILIQRNEESAAKEPILFYSKLPSLVGKNVVLVDPMLATGGSAKVAVQVLIDKGALESKITFLNVVSCPLGLTSLLEAYPAITVVTGSIDYGLNSNKYIVPGLGDFGDRYFGTVDCI